MATKKKAPAKKQAKKTTTKAHKKPGPKKGYKRVNKTPVEQVVADDAKGVVDGASPVGGYGAGDMTSAAAQGFRAGQESEREQDEDFGYELSDSLKKELSNFFASMSWQAVPALSFKGLDFCQRVAILSNLESGDYVSHFAPEDSKGLTEDYTVRLPLTMASNANINSIEGIRFNHVNRIVFPIYDLDHEEAYCDVLEISGRLNLSMSEVKHQRPETVVIDGETYVRQRKI